MNCFHVYWIYKYSTVFVSSTLTTTWFWRHHVYIMLPQGCNLFVISFLLSPDLLIIAPSANKQMSLKWSSREISLMKTRNNKGTRIDPCGTTYFTGAGSDILFLIFTDCLLLLRYDKNHSCVFSLHLYNLMF